MAETRLSVSGKLSAGVLGSAESKTVNKPELVVGLVVVKTYFPSELVTGVPAAVPSTGAVVNTSLPSAMFNAVTYELYFDCNVFATRDPAKVTKTRQSNEVSY